MPHVYPRHSAWATPSPACVNRSRELTLYQPCEQEGFALEPLAQICRRVWFAPVVEERQEGWKCTRAYVGVAQLLARLHGRVAIDCCSLVPLVVIIAHTNPNHGILRLQQPPPLSARLQLTRGGLRVAIVAIAHHRVGQGGTHRHRRVATPVRHDVRRRRGRRGRRHRGRGPVHTCVV